MKWVIRIGAVLVILLVVVVVVVVLALNGIVKSAVQTAGSTTTGVETTLGGVSIGLLSGGVELDEFNLGQPEGFKSEKPLFALSEADVQVQLGSVLSDTVIVPKAHIDGAHVTVAFENGKLNISEVMKHIEEVTGGGEDAPADDSAGKKVIIEDLRITNTKVTGALSLVPGTKPVEIDIKLADIQKQNVGSDGSGMTLNDVTGFILETIFANTFQQIGSMPGLDGLGDLAGNLGGAATGAIGDVGGAATGAIDDAGKKLGEGLGGLLGGKKKTEEAPAEE